MKGRKKVFSGGRVRSQVCGTGADGGKSSGEDISSGQRLFNPPLKSPSKDASKSVNLNCSSRSRLKKPRLPSSKRTAEQPTPEGAFVSSSESEAREFSAEDSEASLSAVSGSDVDVDSDGDYVFSDAEDEAASDEEARSAETARLKSALGERLQGSDDAFLDFVLSAQAQRRRRESCGDASAADPPPELQEEAGDEEPSSRAPRSQELSLERFVHICAALGFDPLEQQRPPRPSAEEKAASASRVGVKGLQLLGAVFRSAAMEFISREEEETAAAAAASASEASVGSRAKFKEVKEKLTSAEEDAKRSPASRRAEKKVKTRARPVSLFSVPDPETREVVLVSTLRHADSLFTQAARGGKAGAEGSAPLSASASSRVLSPSTLAGFERLRPLLRSLWGDVAELLTALQQTSSRSPAHESLLLQLLLALGSKLLSRWTFFAGGATRRLTLSLARCWAFARGQELQLAAFAALRTHLALIVDSPVGEAAAEDRMRGGAARGGEKTSREKGKSGAVSARRHLVGEMEQQFLQLLLRLFQRAAARAPVHKRPWRSVSRTQLLINEFVQLLAEANADCVYRLAFEAIRESALIVRSALLNTGQGCSATPQTKGSASAASASPSKKGGAKEKALYRRRRRQAQVSSLLYCWSFVSGAELWAAALGIGGEKTGLRPLLFPLVSLLLAAVKMQVSQALSFTPFSLRLLRCAALAGVHCDSLVPVASPLLHFLGALLAQHARVCRRENGPVLKGSPQQQKSGAPHMLGRTFVAHPEICLKLNALQLQSLDSLEAMVEFGTSVLASHLTHLVRHPAFPEVFLPIQASLKQVLKKAEASAQVRTLQQLNAAATASSEVVKRLRLSLGPLPVGRVSVLDTPSHKSELPILALSERLEAERTKLVERGVNEEAAASELRKKKEAEEKLSSKQMKRRRHKERQRQTQESGEDAPFQGSQAKEGGRKKRKVGKQMGASTDKEVPGARNRQGGQDVLEEFDANDWSDASA